MAWTDETVDVLKALWGDGRSAREIAGRLGMTRNAVIGKANRLGLSHKSRPQAARKEPAPRVSEHGQPMSPLELTERMCRWPIGHPGDADFRFCGNQRVPSRPYCEQHCMMAYRGRVVEAA